MEKTFLFLFLQGFSLKEILKRHFIDCFKTNGKQRIIMLKKVNTLNSKTVKEKLSHQL